jgi:hypothetical protein
MSLDAWLCGLDDVDFDDVNEPEERKEPIKPLDVDEEPQDLEDPESPISPLQHLLLEVNKTEIPSYAGSSSFKKLAHALRSRPLTAMETNRFLQRFAVFRSPMITQLSSKRLLAKNAKAYVDSNNMPLPEGFVLPEDVVAIQTQILSNSMPVDGIWIAKPSGFSQGKGIKVFQGLNAAIQENRRKHCVIQRYVEPLLLDGFKFDFRLYVFITSICPIEAHFHPLGYARFCGKQYDTSTLDDKCAHLTNVAVNKYACDTSCSLISQSYVRIEAVWNELAKQGVNIPSIQAKIKDALRKILLSTEAAVAQKAKASLSEVANDERKHFQLMGFDVLLDKDCTPVILEANTSPDIFELEAQQQLIFDMLTKLFQPSITAQRSVREEGVGGEEEEEEEPKANAPEEEGGAQEIAALHDNTDCSKIDGIAEDWARGGDQLLRADEWCSEHWRWSACTSKTAAAAGAGGAGGAGDEEEKHGDLSGDESSGGFSSLF